jgi:hypothetical protein
MRETRCPRRLVVVLAAIVGVLQGCQGAEVTECRERYLVTHAQVGAVDPNDLASVSSALDAVRTNLEVCERAKLTEETKQLSGALRKLESQGAFLEVQGSQKELTSEELEALEKQGDPDCPKGQVYQYKKSGKRIRCTGSQVLTMSLQQAKTYFGGRGFKLSETGDKLKTERGSESYTFDYTEEGREQPATCVVVFSPPGIAWQETVARLSGAAPARLKVGTPVRVGKSDIPYSLEADPVQAILRFGTCANETTKAGEGR